MVEVTVVIPNYNGKAYIEKCLRSLEKQDFKEYEVIVADNGSTDGSREQVENDFPNVRLLKLTQNFGFSRAVNEGITATKTPYVLLLNNDTEVSKDFVYEMLKAIKKSEKIFSVAAKMMQLNQPEKIDGAGDYYSALGWAFASGKGKTRNHYDKEREVFSACAGAAIYRKKILDEIGYFDEFHFAYLEDLDIGYRAKIMGYKNMYTPKAVVYHAGSGYSGSRYNEFKIRLSSRNNIYVIYKNMPVIQIIINFPLLFLGFFIKAAFFIMKGYGRAYLSGIKRGYLLCYEGRRLEYSNRNFKNYARIQLELWINTVRRFVEVIF
ncbi:MAG: glycosyltransferase family 2 protein [Lachnospiraceae bacterium]|nr:glycosyltransferase family 2 protein [Lachnospiraceae bacterium]